MQYEKEGEQGLFFLLICHIVVEVKDHSNTVTLSEDDF